MAQKKKKPVKGPRSVTGSTRLAGSLQIFVPSSDSTITYPLDVSGIGVPGSYVTVSFICVANDPPTVYTYTTPVLVQTDGTWSVSGWSVGEGCTDAIILATDDRRPRGSSSVDGIAVAESDEIECAITDVTADGNDPDQLIVTVEIDYEDGLTHEIELQNSYFQYNPGTYIWTETMQIPLSETPDDETTEMVVSAAASGVYYFVAVLTKDGSEHTTSAMTVK
jgi:hypothetical protein